MFFLLLLFFLNKKNFFRPLTQPEIFQFENVNCHHIIQYTNEIYINVYIFHIFIHFVWTDRESKRKTCEFKVTRSVKKCNYI